MIKVTALILLTSTAHISAGALHIAALDGNLESVRQELKTTPINSKNCLQNTALHNATAFGRLEVVLLLLKSGADVNATGARQTTPLHIATQSGNTEVVFELLSHGADINAQDMLHNTPLCDTLKELYAAILDPKSKTTDDYFDILNILLEHHAKTNAGHADNRNALDICSTSTSEDIQNVRRQLMSF